MAQVKEGTESKGAIESVVRVIRKTVCEFVMKRKDNLLITLVAPDNGTTAAIGTK
jgi:hypothetical protein